MVETPKQMTKTSAASVSEPIKVPIYLLIMCGAGENNIEDPPLQCPGVIVKTVKADAHQRTFR